MKDTLRFARLLPLAALALLTAAVLTARAQEYGLPPDPAPVRPWIRCAEEGAICKFIGTRRVRYGAVDVFREGTFAESVECSNAIFGDPLYGVVKVCDYEGDELDISKIPPSAWQVPTPRPVRITVARARNDGILIGDVVRFSASVTDYQSGAPVDYPAPVGWFVAEGEGIEVDGNGVVTAKAAGEARLFARVMDGESAGALSAPVEINVPTPVVRISGSGSWLRVGQSPREYRANISGSRAPGAWSIANRGGGGAQVASLRVDDKGNALVTPRSPGRAVLKLCVVTVCDETQVKVY